MKTSKFIVWVIALVVVLGGGFWALESAPTDNPIVWSEGSVDGVVSDFAFGFRDEVPATVIEGVVSEAQLAPYYAQLDDFIERWAKERGLTVVERSTVVTRHSLLWGGLDVQRVGVQVGVKVKK